MLLVKKIRRILGAKAQRLHRDERGLEGIEYLLIAALVIIAAIGAWKLLGQKVSEGVVKEATKIEQTVDESIDASNKAPTIK
jgi:Flp pilus assembly pilin Flp